MGPEIVAAIVGPIIGGSITLLVFFNKQNSDLITKQFITLNENVKVVEDKVTDLSVEVAKNYVTNDILTAHIKGEEDWHNRFNKELSDIKEDIRDIHRKIDR